MARFAFPGFRNCLLGFGKISYPSSNHPPFAPTPALPVNGGGMGSKGRGKRQRCHPNPLICKGNPRAGIMLGPVRRAHYAILLDLP